MREEWSTWKESLKHLEQVRIPIMYTSISFCGAAKRELCILCDTSTKAIAAVAYAKVTDTEGKSELGFVFGKAKLAPQQEIYPETGTMCSCSCHRDCRLDFRGDRCSIPLYKVLYRQQGSTWIHTK